LADPAGTLSGLAQDFVALHFEIRAGFGSMPSGAGKELPIVIDIIILCHASLRWVPWRLDSADDFSHE
jgi:hypothetical protein